MKKHVARLQNKKGWIGVSIVLILMEMKLKADIEALQVLLPNELTGLIVQQRRQDKMTEK
ncbi:hypothetical protein [Peribacillus simplex]|uniref:hypothetical protein n=1 Tax=Peribacillus simplex TaxID=1478 RepID=UPI0024C1CC55|nr:hypothetical protein [Peribacillus simplex]WHY58907.1 hypothetical protein QNH43_11925 [Peribacillus simplex]